MLEFLDRLHLDMVRLFDLNRKPDGVFIRVGGERVNMRVLLLSKLKAHVQVNIGDFSQEAGFSAEEFKNRCEDRLAVYLQRIVIDARKRGKGVYKDLNDLYDYGGRDAPWVC